MFVLFCESPWILYWSKVLTDQSEYRFIRKHKIVNNPKRATIKQVIIHLSKLLKFIFRKSHCVTFFLSKNWTYPIKIRAFNFTTVDYPVYWTFKITLSSIGFEWKKKCWLFSLRVLSALRFISETFFIKGYGVWLPTSVNSISIQFMVILIRQTVLTTYTLLRKDVWITWKQ